MKLRYSLFSLFTIIIFTFILESCKSLAPTEQSRKDTGGEQEQNVTLDNIIPKPQVVLRSEGAFVLSPGASIIVSPNDPEINQIGQYLAEKLNPSTGFNINVSPAPAASNLKVTAASASANLQTAGNIYLTTSGADPLLGEEGYSLTISKDSVKLTAFRPAGLFRGIQTIRQLFPSSIESQEIQPGPWVIAAGTIRDMPRFQWRGTMLDVSRHFFSLQDLKRYIDLMALYKINRFHIHLSDDQGWRIAINSWPNLALIGGSTQVGGGKGGYYTQAEYSDIVAYAKQRYITVVPEIDMPGHTNAALASYPELNTNGIAPKLYTGIEVGFSSFSIYKELTYTFIDNVIGEIAALTPGAYMHIGGDEAKTLSQTDYDYFVDRVQKIAQKYNKQVVGWEEIANIKLLSNSIVQFWSNPVYAQKAAQQGVSVIMSPAPKMYMDMKYNPSTELGLDWAGRIEVKDAYLWDPAAFTSGVTEKNILGVEAPLWSETLTKISDIEYMAFPRLIGYAEIGWSRQSQRDWEEYKTRLGIQGSRLEKMKVNFYRSEQVPWQQ